MVLRARPWATTRSRQRQRTRPATKQTQAVAWRSMTWTLPEPVRLFVVPGADAFTYDKTLLATDNLSIASYAITVPVEPAERR